MKIKGGESSMVHSVDEGKGCGRRCLHKEFQKLGRERNRITYKLLALLPKIYKEKVYEAEGFGSIYEYAGRLAGLSHSVVEKALKLEKKLEGKPHLQKMIETQGIHKVAMVSGIATEENDEVLADKVEHMSKNALQEYSKELRGKVTIAWKIEMDEEMMVMFLKLKKEMGGSLSNKEAMRKLLLKMSAGKMMQEKLKPQRQAHVEREILEQRRSEQGERSLYSEHKQRNFLEEKRDVDEKMCSGDGEGRRVTRYIPVKKKREVLSKTDGKCSHPGCCKPAEVLHHRDRFSVSGSHESIVSLCKAHHEFAHNGVGEKMCAVDYKYRKHRQVALL